MSDVWFAPRRAGLGDLAPQTMHQLAEHIPITTLGAPDVVNYGFSGQDMPCMKHQVIEESGLKWGE